MEQVDIQTRDERIETNQIIVRHYLFSQFIPLQT
jgi:hypothetical protein